MFQQMLTRARLAPSQVVHIGDHPEHDILGAQNCGLHTLWVNFSGQSWPGAQPPDLEVDCLSQIVPALQAFAASHSSPDTDRQP